MKTETSDGSPQTGRPMPSSIKVNGTIFHVADALPHPFWSLVNEGRWEPATFRLLDHYLMPNWRFVDVGAWIGPTALYAAKKCERIDAFECDPVAIRQLRDNLALNPDIAPKVRLHEYALGDTDGFVRMFSRALGNSETSIFATHEREGAVVKCGESVLVGSRDVRTVFRDHGYANCERTLVKVDVERAEFRIVPHLGELIAESRCVWYVSFHELNVNPLGIPPRHARIGEMLHSLSAFAPLRWYDADLQELDKVQVLDAVLTGSWPIHATLLFSSSART
jgi:FkbM family methyltransferase